MVTLTTLAIKNLFEEQVGLGNVKRYRKTSKVLWRRPLPGETIVTTCGGTIETIRTIETGYENKCVVVMNIQIGTSAELYIINDDKFFPRYIMCEKVFAVNGQRWELAIAQGEVDGHVYNSMDITFDAPWGESMLLTKGDMLVRIPGTEDDIYRIARNEFDLTYEESLE